MGPGAARRLAGVAALLLVAAVALRPGGERSSSGSQVGFSTASVVVAGACGALAAACAVLALRALRTLRGLPPGDPPRRRSVVQQILTLSLCAALLVSPLGSLLVQRLGERFDPANRPEISSQEQRRSGARARTEPRPAPLAEAAALGAGLVLLGLVTAAVLRRRRDRAVRPHADDDTPELSDALSAGVAALAEPDSGDPRDRVIRCYAAMERVLAAGGTARRVADTPTEFLARVQVSGRVPPGPAAALTELFRAARYGPGPITAREVDAAREHLRALQAAGG